MRQTNYQHAAHVDGGPLFDEEPHLTASPVADRPRLAAVPDLHQRSAYERLVKPVMDVVAAGLLCLILSPVLLAIAAAVYVKLGAPVLIRQDRVGRDGAVFAMYKFRSMHHDRRHRHAGWNGPERRVCHKRADDPRLVGLGRFLRKWSLDELPQLLNIVRGEMSFVGPRPELASIVEQYEPWQHARHQVKPGLTGWWQITSRNLGPMHHHTAEDLRYLGRVSLRTDLGLMIRTVPAVMLKMRGQ